MIRFLLSLGISVVSAALALLVAAAVVDGVRVQAAGFIVAVLVFALAQALLAPFVFSMARKYASAILGGIGIVSTMLALFVATLFPGGLQIQGLTAWIVTPLVVWLITALGTWILGALIIKRWWINREPKSAGRNAQS